MIRTSVVINNSRGWSSSGEPPDKRGGKRFDFSPDVTPARGLILIRAAKVLNDPKYLAAADGVARALAAAQLPSGYVPAAVTMLPAGARSEQHSTPILPASSTAAAVAFWLEYVDAGATPPERWRACARIGVNWLMQQQLGAGGFLAPTTAPAVGAHPTRRIDLTTTDYRNIVCTLLLASRLEGSRPAANAADKAVARLLSLRLMNQAGAPSTTPAASDDASTRNLKAALSLWADVYEADGAVADGETRMHIRASSQAVQTLTAAALLDAKSRWQNDLRLSGEALEQLRDDGKWNWQYAALPTTQPAIEPARSTFGPLAATTQPAAFDLAKAIDTCKQTELLSQPELTKKLEQLQSIADRLSGVVCGLNESLNAPAETPLGKLWDDLHR